MRKQWQHTRDPRIKSALNRQTSLVRDLLHSHRDESWSNFLETISPNQNGWDKIYKLNKRLLKKKPPDHPLTDPQGTLHFDAPTKAELFADAMEEQFRLNPSLAHTQTDNIVHSTIAQFKTQPYTKSLFFSPFQVWLKIKKLTNGKAPGPDNISNNVLKYSGREVILHLAHIFNGCARAEYFPKAWKNATMIMLPKPGKDTKFPINHRPISLLNSMGKILESLLLDKLKFATSTRPEQFGFKAHHRTTLQLINVLDRITNSLNRRNKTAAALLDIEKAFDRVWHDGLIYKLIRKNVPHQLTNLITSFLSNRSFRVSLNNCFSSTRYIEAGVPQESYLSPQLFLCYIDDIPLSNNAKIALFADDAFIYATRNSNNRAVSWLQDQVDLMEPWFQHWKISINANKTLAILFSNKSSSNTPKIKINNQEINWSPSIKYLGINIDKKLNFTKQTNFVVNRARAAKNILYPVINHLSPIPLRMRLYIYYAYIRPILLNASPVWTSKISKCSWKKRETVQTVTLRTITGSPWFVSNKTLLNSTQTPVIEQYVTDSKTKLVVKLRSTPHNHLSDIINKTAPRETSLKRPLTI